MGLSSADRDADFTACTVVAAVVGAVVFIVVGTVVALAVTVIVLDSVAVLESFFAISSTS